MSPNSKSNTAIEFPDPKNIRIDTKTTQITWELSKISINHDADLDLRPRTGADPPFSLKMAAPSEFSSDFNKIGTKMIRNRHILVLSCATVKFENVTSYNPPLISTI